MAPRKNMPKTGKINPLHVRDMLLSEEEIKNDFRDLGLMEDDFSDFPDYGVVDFPEVVTEHLESSAVNGAFNSFTSFSLRIPTVQEMACRPHDPEDELYGDPQTRFDYLEEMYGSGVARMY